MIKLSVAVMAHPARAEFVPGLVERLGISESQVAWDEKNDRWDTGCRAWRMHASGATHHLVIQDDALVCHDLIPGLTKALEYVPKTALVSPFMGTRRPATQKIERMVRYADKINASWIVIGPLNWGVSILTPTDHIEEMLAWGKTQKYPNYDKRIGQFYRRVKPWPTWYTWPNLVDHREVPSLIGHGGGRVAHRFLGEDESALNVTWDNHVVDYGRASTMGKIRNVDQERVVRRAQRNQERQEQRREKRQEELVQVHEQRLNRRQRIRAERAAQQMEQESVEHDTSG